MKPKFITLKSIGYWVNFPYNFPLKTLGLFICLLVYSIMLLLMPKIIIYAALYLLRKLRNLINFLELYIKYTIYRLVQMQPPKR